jgi:transcriptional regulator with XRE-family HTH domain
MTVCERIKQLRQEKGLSQGHIEKKTGLLRCYVSRVENGHTVPSVETLAKFAQALEVPLYQLFVDGTPKGDLKSVSMDPADDDSQLRTIRRYWPNLPPKAKKLLVNMAAQSVPSKK